MKKLVFFSSLILILLLGISVSAHEGHYDFFDFEKFVGNDETLNAVPAAGTWGDFGINNRTSTHGADGITSELTDKGTSLVLVRRYAPYPGVYYTHKFSSYDVTETIHTSFSIKITGTISRGYVPFRFRKRGSSNPYNIIIFHDNRQLSILGEDIKSNGATTYYQKDVWYDVDVVYDVPSGYCKVHITDGNGFDIYREGISGYEDNLTSIERVMIETVGSVTEDYALSKIYIDDWLIETKPRMYVQKNINDFSDFVSSPNGAKVSPKYMLTGFLAKSDDNHSYSGVFTEETDRGRSLVLAQNTNKNTALWSSFNDRVSGGTVFETDIMLSGLDSDVSVFLGNDSVYEKALKIEAKTGNVYAFNQSLGCFLKPGIWYNLKLKFDTTTSHGYLEISDSSTTVRKAFSAKTLPFTKVFNYKLSLSDYGTNSTNAMKAYFDNMSLYGCDNIYHSFYNKTEDITLSSSNGYTHSLQMPNGICGTKYFEYDFIPSQNVVIGINTASGKTEVISIDSEALTLTAFTGETAAFEKDLPIKIKISLDATALSMDISSSNATLISSSSVLNNDGNDIGTYINSDLSSSDKMTINTALCAIKHPFDISSYSVEDTNTILVTMNNPIDTSRSFTASVNRVASDTEVIDAHTIKITHTQGIGEANIKLSGIRDVFGQSATKSCELIIPDAQKGFNISSPVFFAAKDGTISETNSLCPGTVTAITNIKKAY